MKADTIIRDIAPPQAPALRRLFQRAVAQDFSYFPEAYQSQVLRDNSLPHLLVASLRPNRILLGARTAKELIGYVIAGTNGNDTGKIYWLYVAPEGRGQSLGRLLLVRSLEKMHQRGMRRVSLVTHNYDDYYTRFGFKVEKRQQLYGVPMNVMSYQWPNQ